MKPEDKAAQLAALQVERARQQEQLEETLKLARSLTARGVLIPASVLQVIDRIFDHRRTRDPSAN